MSASTIFAEEVTKSLILEECMVGLCPTCVCQHTEFHHRHNTLPDYQTITSTYSVTEDMLHEYKVML